MTVKPSRNDSGEADLRIQRRVVLVFQFSGFVVMRAGKEISVGYRVLVGYVAVVSMVELQVKMQRR